MRKLAIYEGDLKHTEIMGVFLAWAKRRNVSVALFVADTTFRSYMPLYNQLFGPLDIRHPSEYSRAFRGFDVTVFATSAPHLIPPFPADVLALQRRYPKRMVYVLHHAEGRMQEPTSYQRRLLTLTPLVSSPFLTPAFLDADALFGPRLRLSQRDRALCLIGTGMSRRYNGADIRDFFDRQREAAAANAAAAADAPPPRRGAHATDLSFPLGMAAARGFAGRPADAAASASYVRHAGVDWDPQSLRWYWPPTAAGAAPRGGGTAGRPVRRFYRQYRFTSGSSPANTHALTRAALHAGVARPVASALRSGREREVTAALASLLRGPALVNDARPVDAVTADLHHFDADNAVAVLRRCAFLLVHPTRTAREVRTRMTGALPTALIMRTPLLAPRYFTGIYGLSAGSLTFNASLAEVEATLLDMSDEAYERILDEFDAFRRRRFDAAMGLLDRVFVDEPSWTGIGKFGPGWAPRFRGTLGGGSGGGGRRRGRQRGALLPTPPGPAAAATPPTAPAAVVAGAAGGAPGRRKRVKS